LLYFQWKDDSWSQCHYGSIRKWKNQASVYINLHQLSSDNNCFAASLIAKNIACYLNLWLGIHCTCKNRYISLVCFMCIVYWTYWLIVKEVGGLLVKSLSMVNQDHTNSDMLRAMYHRYSNHTSCRFCKLVFIVHYIIIHDYEV